MTDRQPNWENRTLFVADNLSILRGMNSETVDCIATDPPFNAKRLFHAPLESRAAGQKFDDTWRWDEVTDEWLDVLAADHPAIKEIIEAAAVIEGGSLDRRTGHLSTGRTKNSIAAYLAWMAPRIIEMHRVLKPTGVLFMHCDTEANSYLRLLLDAVFGRALFINEVVRRRTPAKGFPTRRLPRNHDTIFAYGKSRRWKWNPSYEPYNMANLDEKTLKQYRLKDESGRRYQLDNLTHPEGNRPNLTYEFLGVTRVWRWTRERMEAEYRAGRVVQSAPGRVPRFKRHLDEQPGRKRDSIWTDMVQVESSGSTWATRKPVALYARLIECATNKDDIVLDPFAGCATTCVAAELLDRRWVAIDIDLVAKSETERRLFDEAKVTTENPVTVRKTLRRTDIPSVSDARLRLQIWNRQGHLCANPYCDSKPRAKDLALDHRIPKKRGGPDDPSNRIGLCHNCNSRKSAKAWGLFLDEERSRQPHPTVAPKENPND